MTKAGYIRQAQYEYVGSQNRLIENSQRRKSWFMKNRKEENERECLIHQGAFWGKSGAGYWFKQCSEGYAKKEACKAKSDLMKPRLAG